jgi:transaldolase/glucose-6-phosphate isomerase
MQHNPLLKLQEYGQSIWLDYLRRNMLTSGELKKLIDEDGIRGITSNPAIFEKAIGGSDDYTSAIHTLAHEQKSVDEIYRDLTVHDIQEAADLFRETYENQKRQDGYVSLEVSPKLARDTEGTIAEAKELWKAVNRPNVMIKVPGTKEGLPAIRKLISEGINVNVTLLFGLDRYPEVIDAYLGGLEDRVKAGEPIDSIASVASFFLSRIDVLVDKTLEEIMQKQGDKASSAAKLRGQVAIASAKAAYEIFKDQFSGERFSKLNAMGANVQRLLWASTSTKNPQYSDVKYPEALIGPQTVNTLPMETINAYRDHGNPAANRLTENPEEAKTVLNSLSRAGIDLNAVTDQLVNEGIDKFIKPFNKLMETIERRRAEAFAERVDNQRIAAGSCQKAIDEQVAVMSKQDFSERIWRKDTSLWSGDSKIRKQIANSLGWLRVIDKVDEDLPSLLEFVSEVEEAGFTHVVHMGMGGSSLAPMVFERSFENETHGLKLIVLDTTDPDTISRIEQSLPIDKTLFIVASKSGTTTEPLRFGDYFYGRVRELKKDRAGENFIAITDPETPLVQQAHERRFRRVFLNFSDIGGRYSALSYFGIVPAALMGLDVGQLLERAARMACTCDSSVPVDKNPGLMLGIAMGELANQGRDKLTFIMPEKVASLGMWLEQLIAESTGKEGKGILPVAGEAPGSPEKYGNDRVFAHLRLPGADNRDQQVDALRNAGHPVITIEMADKLDLGQEMFRWEIATAAAGAVIGINPFDQPNVQESKDNTNRLLGQFDKDGKLPSDQPTVSDGPLTIYASDNTTEAGALLSDFLDHTGKGGYIALQAYVKEDPTIEQLLQEIRIYLRDRSKLATTVGYGPRFLHSTGQYHKGGPDNGSFIQLTVSSREDLAIPEQKYTFGVLKQAQAQGDLEALRKHGRRVVRIDLGTDVTKGLEVLRDVLEAAEVHAVS